MTVRPMLAGKVEDATALKFPLFASVKLDGVRALVIGGKLVSRTLKNIPNAYAQELFSGLPEGVDGELIVGDPAASDAYRQTVSAVMSEDGRNPELRFHVFDNFVTRGGFEERFRSIQTLAGRRSVVVVEHLRIEDADALTQFEEDTVNAGHEGVMIRAMGGIYKQGRSTWREGLLLKLKRFEDAEAVITDTEELMHNGNEATTNALGRTERSTRQDNLVGRDALGALHVRGVGGTYDGVAFKIGTGFLASERIDLWKIRTKLVGKIVKFKFFATGSKDRPRFPVMLGFRDEIDL